MLRIMLIIRWKINLSYAVIMLPQMLIGNVKARLNVISHSIIWVRSISVVLILPPKSLSAFIVSIIPATRAIIPMKEYMMENIPNILRISSFFPSALNFAVYLTIALPNPKSSTVRYEIMDAANEYKEVTGSNGGLVFSFGPSVEQETYQIYMVLKHICESQAMIWHGLRMQYGRSKYQEIVKEFNDRVVLVMINNINDYLARIGIDMGLDENVVFNVSGGQVNVASGNATINATQNNGVSTAELESIVKNILDNVSTLNSTDAETIIDSVEMIKEEMLKPEPKGKIISNGIKLLAPMISIANGVPVLAENIQGLIDMAMMYIH